MLKGTRSICLDVCDYNNNVLCNLYDNTADVSGQATDVFVITERNGWKELTFTIPSTCWTEDGEEPNFRLQYLIADYRIRLQSGIYPDIETDWFLISEPKVIHNKFSNDVSVTAGHVVQLLKYKNLNLEFSDDEGNNGGTAEQLLATILDGTGWSVGYVEDFLEDDGETVKYRTITAPAKTGAFKLISTVADKFDAKPVYHGDTKTVDLVKMNPFSEVEEGEIPQEVLEGKNVLELQYDRNVSRIQRTLNTENIVTRLYAYGSYGDDNGLCSLQVCKHKEYTFTLTAAYATGKEFAFHDDAWHYFTTDRALTSGNKLIWSKLDTMSKSYVWDVTRSRAYSVYSEPKTNSWTTLSYSTSEVENKFDYLMDFHYYEKVGLLTDDMKQTLARFQREMPDVIDASTNASAAFIASQQELSEISESNTGFLRFAVSSYTTGPDGELKLILSKSTQYPDGVMYRSDYYTSKKNYFSWYCAESLKENGDPTSGIGSVVYIIHNTSPQTWEKAYVKYIDDQKKTNEYGKVDSVDPSSLTLWLSRNKVGTLSSGDRFYLFCTNSNSGRLGVKETELESLEQTLQNTTKIVTEEHPTYFVWDNDSAPSTSAILKSYGWYYRSYSNTMNSGNLYFCYGVNGENTWHPVIIAETDPTVTNGSYYFNTRSKKLYHGESGRWVWYEDVEGKRLAANFSKVAFYCLKHDMIYKGLYDKYIYTVPSGGLTAGNYAIKNDFGFYWVLTTDIDLQAGKTLWVDTQKNLVYQTQNTEDIVKPEAKPFDTIDFPVVNDLTDTVWNQGTINKTTGVEVGSNTLYRSNHISLYGGTTYKFNLPSNSFAVCYNSKRRYVTYHNLSGTGTFTLSEDTKYVRFVVSSVSTSNYVQVNDYTNRLFISNKEYRILYPVTSQGSRIGIMYLIKAFADTADQCYLNYYEAYKTAQKTVKERNDLLTDTLGDLHRETAHQKNDYVEGDEDLLYKDASEILDKVSKPEATYDITFLDLYSSNMGEGYSIDGTTEDVDWPDIQMTDAVHMIDTEIDTNCWAFIDKLSKCYDKPWQTSIEINTNLSLISQKSFTDVLTRIAEVANETAGKQSIYKRAAALTSTGYIAAQKLEGTINVNKTLITGGQSNWHTDEKGNMIFESADGLSAMMLSGYGWAVSTSKTESGDWNFRYTTTGHGMTADEIVAGTISGQLIEAGSITTEQLHANVGQLLEIGSNKALLLYATVDGLRPAGALQTQVNNGDGTFTPVGSGDSYIEIAAKTSSSQAHINIMSGGEVNLQGSTLNLKATSKMYLLANSILQIRSNSDIEINANSKLNIVSGSDLTIRSPHFNVYKDSSNIYRADIDGVVKSKAGQVAGFTIGATYKDGAAHDPEIDANVKNRFIYSGTDSLTSTAHGIYLGTDGVNIAGKRFLYDIANKSLRVEADYVAIGKYSSGSTALITIDGASNTISLVSQNTINIAAGSTVNITSGKTVTIASTGNVVIGNSGSAFTIGSNRTNAYIYNGMTSRDDTTHNGVYVGTDGIALGKGLFKVTNAGALTATSATIKGMIQAETGRIGSKNGSGGWIIEQDMIYADNKTVVLSSASGSDYRFYAGNATAGSAAFYVMKDGTIKATKGSVAGWTIDDSKFVSSNKFVGISSTPGTNNTGIAFYAGNTTPASAPFRVTHAGALTATSAEITGIIKANTGYIGGSNGWVIAENFIRSSNSVTGMYSVPGTGNANVAFWAGNTTPASAPFSVTHAGALTATNANIKGTISSTNANIKGTVWATSLYVGDSDAHKTLLAVDSTTGKLILNADDLAYIGAADSGLYITPTSVKIGTTGKFELKSTNFEVSTNGTITAKAGTIGNWNIHTNQLDSGVSTLFVALSSDINNNYAIWCGAENPESAPFRIRRDGVLFADQIVVVNDNGEKETLSNFASQINSLRNWRITEVSDSGKVTLANGKTFSSAASVKLSATWSGGGSSSYGTYYLNIVAKAPSAAESDKTTVTFSENANDKIVTVSSAYLDIDGLIDISATYKKGDTSGYARGKSDYQVTYHEQDIEYKTVKVYNEDGNLQRSCNAYDIWAAGKADGIADEKSHWKSTSVTKQGGAAYLQVISNVNVGSKGYITSKQLYYGGDSATYYYRE